MQFLFSRKPDPAEKHGWNLVPDKAGFIAARNVRTLIDAGTGEGERLAYFLRNFPNAIIHCFEPAEEAFAQLEKAYRKHRRVILNRMALCGSSGLSQHGQDGIPCKRPAAPMLATNEPLPEQHLVRVTLDDYCRVCRIDEIDLLRLPGTATEVCLYNGARLQLADRTIRALLVPLKPSAPESHAAVTEIVALNRGLERYGFALHGVRGAKDGDNAFKGHMLYLLQNEAAV